MHRLMEWKDNCRLARMMNVSSPYFDPDFDKLVERINGPALTVRIDNESLEDCSIIKINRIKKQDLLLEVVQTLTDLSLTITKGYISSDADWFMDAWYGRITSHTTRKVFHVKDQHGNKLDDLSANYIQQRMQAIGAWKSSSESHTAEPPPQESTTLEIKAIDRPGLFSEISAVLADLRCNIIEAHTWTHNARLACIAYISDPSSHTLTVDPPRLSSIEEHLTAVLRTTTTSIDVKQQVAKTADIPRRKGMITNVERRLHQLMLSIRDFDSLPHEASSSSSVSDDEGRKTLVSIESCNEKGYSIVMVECRDHPRLMFDTVCTLIDMQYVIFHAFIRSHDGSAFQEYFIRNTDGCLLNTKDEKDRAITCLEASINRRVSEGVKLEICADNRLGLLSNITRVLRENGLAVVRADVETEGEKAIDNFYVRDTSGKNVDMETLELIKRELGAPVHHLHVRKETGLMPSLNQPHGFHIQDVKKFRRFSLCDMLRFQFSSIRDMLKSHLKRFCKFVMGVLTLR
ncbi:hypothetical protein Nepgr_033414 [Nepenthes gracilis]|uniref:ACT domain-containing protein ACR n=1 Tax=Nepenthes gracilis TaxID=150966 RepID=A0AAD3TL58_NEPGR|nr:hypothetical protein Nepgr_033414 [Nepenthes gracilis]